MGITTQRIQFIIISSHSFPVKHRFMLFITIFISGFELDFVMYVTVNGYRFCDLSTQSPCYFKYNCAVNLSN